MAFYHAHCQYGYYCKDVLVNVDTRFNYMQAGVFKDRNIPNNIWLMSYESVIIGYNDITEELIFPSKQYGFSSRDIASPDYSRTTARHVSEFCKRYCPQFTYYDVKKYWHDFYNAYNE